MLKIPVKLMEGRLQQSSPQDKEMGRGTGSYWGAYELKIVDEGGKKLIRAELEMPGFWANFTEQQIIELFVINLPMEHEVSK
jgi:hypothetical protein